MHLGEKFVERVFGRERKPENYVYFAGTFIAISMLIIWPALHFMPDADPIVFIAVYCIATTIGGLAAQSLFGRKRTA